MKKARDNIRCSFFSTVLEMLFPRRCAACHAFYRMARFPAPGDERHALAAFLCPRCVRDFRDIESPLCIRCGAPFASSQGSDHECGRCLSRPPVFQRARSAGYYEGGLRIMIHHLKYKGFAQAAAPLGRILWNAFKKEWATGQIDLVVPVPLHKKRVRRRGFNQAYQLIRPWPALALRQGIEFSPAKITGSLLARRHNTPPQAGLDRRQRVDNVKGAFGVSMPSAVRDRNILLVDDVFTTGATVDACARVLMNSGASQVHVLTLARSV